MEIEVLRIGQRVVRDDRVTTHVALVARSFGAQKIYMNEVNPEIKHTISDINKTWGGNFKIEIISEWKKIIKEKKNAAVKIVHLTILIYLKRKLTYLIPHQFHLVLCSNF